MREQTSILRTAALIAAMGCIAGCASMKWPKFDDSRSTLVLAAGNFSGVRHLDEPPCLMDTSAYEDEGIVVDCFGGPPSRSTLNVYEVVYGSLSDRRPSVAYHASVLGPDIPPGGGEPILVLLHSDGRHFAHVGEQRLIAQTIDGEWAMPIYETAQLTILPCGAESLVQPLRFAHPLPSESLEGYRDEDIEELRQNPRARIDGRRLYMTHGILLRDIRKFMADKTFDTELDAEEYYCHAYEQSD